MKLFCGSACFWEDVSGNPYVRWLVFVLVVACLCVSVGDMYWICILVCVLCGSGPLLVSAFCC